ncbi:MAG: N-acetylglutamate synthase [Myxococcaceae bacterium]|nr:N-acetylglutamate synthase [Myxococcaceae bacterium]
MLPDDARSEDKRADEKLVEERPFVDWFRHCGPYIHAHRNRTFVVAFGGEAVADHEFDRLVHDLALLSSLGVRLVIVHGTRPQIEDRLREAGIASEFHEGLRITRSEALPCVKEAVGTTRVEIESKLSMSQPDSPMSGVRLRVATGNFVLARPVGVRNGVDYWFTGEVRRVDTEAIKQRLDTGAVVLISNLGYSWTGEVFNLGVHDVAGSVAEALGADKLVCLTEGEGVTDGTGKLVREISPSSIDTLLNDSSALLLDVRRWLQAAARACLGGVRRAHLLSRTIDGALLQELYTRDGIGTLVAVEAFEGMRKANVRDLPGIVALIRPLERSGVLVPRSRERLEQEIDHYSVLERDGMVVACVALYPFETGLTGEVSCFAVHPDYRKGGQGERLLSFVEKRAVDAGMKRIFLLTTHTGHWFQERGYEPSLPDALPEERKATYNPARSSRVFIKQLEAEPAR